MTGRKEMTIQTTIQNQASPEAQREAKVAEKGSQKWLQLVVNTKPELINSPISAAIGLRPGEQIAWSSPTRATRYWEYRDNAFIKLLELEPLDRKLADFWPARGPMWDGLAKAGRGKVLLVEAKAHIAEMVTPPPRASTASSKRIRTALEEARNAIAPHTSRDWMGIFYQYTNRLAHLYFLRTLNRKNAHLIYVYFVNADDVGGPKTIEEWRGAIYLLKSYMGLHRHKLSRYIHEIFIDVNAIAAT
jgi:hypothetical protein